LTIGTKEDKPMKSAVIEKTLEEKHMRVERADKFAFSYQNPHVLATLYYTEGLSTTQIAEHLSCHKRTIRRYMNYYGMRRFTKHFSQLVRHHGIENAMKLAEPEFNNIGAWND